MGEKRRVFRTLSALSELNGVISLWSAAPGCLSMSMGMVAEAGAATTQLVSISNVFAAAASVTKSRT